MLTTPHATTGSTIAILIPIPAIAIPLSLASHFVLDKVSHWQETLAPYTPTYKTYLRVPIDLALAIALTILAYSWHPELKTLIWTCAIMANLPDIDALVAIFPKLQNISLINKYWDWHCRIQNETPKFFGVITQAVTIFIGLAISYVR